MILTCPDCATRYFVDETKLGPAGRTVRCASCGASWRAEAEAPLDLTPTVADSARDSGPNAAEALPRSFRAQQEAKRRTRQAVAAGAVWASLAAACALLLVAASVFRVQVVRLWPRTAGAYAALRMPVNPLGLAPEGVQASSGLKDGHAMLFVRGAERNVEASVRPVAPLRVSLYDRGGARLASQVVHVDGAALQPGEARVFQTAFTDPPVAGATVGVDFIFERPHRVATPRPTLAPRTALHVATGSPRLRGVVAAPAPPRPAPALAEPLPAGSPYALPAAASAQSGDLRPG